MILLRLLLPLILIPAAIVQHATAAPVNRPFSGIGVVMLRPLPAEILLYKDPGVTRFMTVAPATLPPLSPVLEPAADSCRAIVTNKRGTWLSIVYDDAGREGWVLLERSWEFFSWNEYLRGRTVKLLPGVKKSFSVIRENRTERAPGVATLNGTPLRVIAVFEDWCKVSGPGVSGWLRWRDGDGRFLVEIDDAVPLQSH